MPAHRGHVLLALVALALLPGAAPAVEHHRLHPEFAARMAKLRTVGLVSASMKVYELSASNDRVFQPEWSDAARGLVAASLKAALERRGLAAVTFEPAPERKEELRDVSLLEEAVVAAVLQATYGYRFPAKVARFEYALGDLEPLLGREGPDALLFVHGTGHISSGGRKAVQALGAILSGGGVSRGIDRLFMTLVDRSGEVLWFDWSASTSYDLRDPGSADAFVRSLTDAMPAVAR